MYYKGQHDPADENNYDVINEQKVMLDETMKLDRGYNKTFRMITRADGRVKKTKVEFYTSSDIGNRIRDAETGDFFSHRVGSLNEDLYFKVGLSTGECKSANGSTTLFFTSPYRYMTHMHCTLPSELIKRWEEKRDVRMCELNSEIKRPEASTIFVN